MISTTAIAAQEWRPATMRNLSLTGICLAADEELAVGDTVQLELSLPPRHRPITVTGKIMWRKQDAPGHSYGVHFVQVTGEAVRVVATAVERALASQGPEEPPSGADDRRLAPRVSQQQDIRYRVIPMKRRRATIRRPGRR